MIIRVLIILSMLAIAACNKPEEDALAQLGELVKQAESAVDPRVAAEKYKQALKARDRILVEFAATPVASNLMAFDNSHPYSAVSIENNIQKKTFEACQRYMELTCLDFLFQRAVADIKTQIKDKRWRRQNDTSIIVVLRRPEPALFAYRRGMREEALFLAEQMQHDRLGVPLATRVKLEQLYEADGYDSAVEFIRGLKGEALEEARRWGVSQLYFQKSPHYSTFAQEFGRPVNVDDNKLEEWARSKLWGEKLREIAVDDIDQDFVGEVSPATAVKWIGVISDDNKSQTLLDLVEQWDEIPAGVVKPLFYKAIQFKRRGLLKRLVANLDEDSVGQGYLATAHVVMEDYSLAREYLEKDDPAAVYLGMLHKQLRMAGQDDLAGLFLERLDQLSAVWWKGGTYRNVWGEHYVCALNDAGRVNDAATITTKFRDLEDGLIALAGCVMKGGQNGDDTMLWGHFFDQLRQLDSLRQLKVIASDEVAELNWPEEKL